MGPSSGCNIFCELSAGAHLTVNGGRYTGKKEKDYTELEHLCYTPHFLWNNVYIHDLVFELSTTIQSIYPFQPQPVDKYVGSPYMIYTK